MGDFNAPDYVSGQSYDYILNRDWQDTYQTALEKDSGFTVPCVIDGWRERLKNIKWRAMRLDYIFCNHQIEITSYHVIFNGENRPVVSDHFGVCIEVMEKPMQEGSINY